MDEQLLRSMSQLSPRRNSSSATSLDELVTEQLQHFSIDPASDFGQQLSHITRNLYQCQNDLDAIWNNSLETIAGLNHPDRIARFNAKKFLSFQLAKLLDNFQNSFRKSYQSLSYSHQTQTTKGPYPVFDNITAIFSATPVITRTATYIYACAEWIADAFKGKEVMLEIYSRLLNPTSISLANYVVDLEAGPYSSEYLAWNFNSGMAAIDATLAHLLGRDDILITSRNLYGGAYQLIHDWYAKQGNLEIAVETFDGYQVENFTACAEKAIASHQDRLERGRQAYVYLESPCNPHGYVLDVPGICRKAHELGMKVMLDATVGTPFLFCALRRDDPMERPDYVIHSYTKDMSGTGSVVAGCVIGRNEDMFIPKGEKMGGRSWEETMFWNVYYVKGAFLNADAAFEVIQGMRTLALRMLHKCINTDILAHFLAAHPAIEVRCNSLQENENSNLRESLLFLGLPSPLFTVDMGSLDTEAFQRFFDSLSPAFGHMISLGQSNTIVSCPALTTHSELSEKALREAGLTPTTIRIAVGDENPMDLINHLRSAAKLTLDPISPGFSDQFLSEDATRELVRSRYVQAQQSYVEHLLDA